MTATITQPAALVASVSSQTNVSINGGSNGSAVVSATGGVGPYTLSSSSGTVSGNTVTGLSAGTYVFTVTDANGNTATASATITQPSALVATIGSQTNVSCAGGSNGSVVVNATGGVSPYTIAPSQTGLISGSYTFTVTDSNGAVATATATITEPASIAVTTNNPSIGCNGGTAVLTATAGGGTGNLVYSLDGVAYQASSSFTVNAGTYSITVKDANGCVATSAPVTLVNPSALSAIITSQTNASGFGLSNGSVVVTANGGTPGYIVSPSQTGLSAGTYTFTVTDANGCTTTIGATITQPSTLVATISSRINVSCKGLANGSVNVSITGGVAPYMIAPSTSGLAAGFYTFTVSDANSNETTVSTTITEPDNLVLNVGAQTNLLCFGAATGVVTLNATGGTSPYSYAVSGGNTQSTPSFTGLSSGTYTFTVTDQNGCTSTTIATVTEPSQITLSSSITNVSCFGGNDGSATVSAVGGVAPYEYKIGLSPYQGITTFNNLSAGVTTVYVKDANGCVVPIGLTISQPAAVTGTITSLSNVTCFGGNDGSVVITPVGGTAPYAISPSATGLTAGNYTFTITDTKGCTGTVSASITEPALLVPSFVSPVLSAFHGTSQTYTLSSAYTSYSWSVTGAATTITAGGNTASNFATVNFDASGSVVFSVTVTNASGCTGTASVTVNVTDKVLVSPRVLLQGPYRSAQGLMHDSLRVRNMLPLSQPYTTGYTHVNSGSEVISSSVLAASGNDAIVDWVFVQLRDANNSSTVVSTRAALLQRDGDVVDLDGVSALSMIVPVGTTNFYLSIKHRNHLGVMTLGTVNLNFTTTTSVDFTNSATPTYTDGRNTAQLGTSVRFLRAGNANSNSEIKAQGSNNDVTALQLRVGLLTPSNIVSGYYREDVNMDGSTKYQGSGNDKTVIDLAVGITTPNNIIYEQTPN